MTVSTIILAAGKGTRMRSPTPKILHKIGGKYLLGFSVELSKDIGSKETIIVVGKENELVTRKAFSEWDETNKWRPVQRNYSRFNKVISR